MTWLKSQNLLVRTELHVPWGVCDIVACEADPQKVEARKKLRQFSKIGSHSKIALFLATPDEDQTRGISQERLCQQFAVGGNRSRIDHEIESLIKHHFLFRTRSGCLRSRNGWKPLHSRLVAVELKLEKVRQALGQATRNQGFADESYVAFPYDLAKQVLESDRRHMFLSDGVGVLGVSDTNCKCLIHPIRKRDRIDSSVELHVVDKFWSEFKSGSYS